MQFPRKKFLTLNGQRIAYSQSGKGPAIFLVHGFPTSSVLWRDVCPALSSRFTTYALDLMGFGDSFVPPQQDCSLPSQSDMIIRFMDRLSIDQAIIVGHDLGGGIAQILALEHPQRVSRLVMANSVAYDNFPVPEVRFLMKLCRARRLFKLMAATRAVEAWAKSALGLARGVYSSAAMNGAMVDEYVMRPFFSSEEGLDRFRKIALTQRDNGRATRQIAPRMKDIHHPTLIVWGAEDCYFKLSWGQRLFAEIPGAEKFIILPRAGHFLPEEKAGQFAGILQRWL